MIETATIDGDTKLCFILGDPIKQVRSPQEFNPVFAERAINAVMLPMHITAAHLSGVLAALCVVRNIAGVVITVPHKESVIAHCYRISDRARAIGSVNAIRSVGGKWEGDNFDGLGFVAGLTGRGFECRGHAAFVVGVGGAGRSVTFALAEAGISRLTLWDVDPHRLAGVAQNVRKHHPELELRVSVSPAPDDALVVNCTPLGMHYGDPLPVDVRGLSSTQLVADIVMHPEITSLLDAARRRGCEIQLGRSMLGGQIDKIIRFFGLQEPR